MKTSFRPLWGSFLFLYSIYILPVLYRQLFPSPMGIFFVSIDHDFFIIKNINNVSVPYGDLFCFYALVYWHSEATEFPSPMGIFFVSIESSFSDEQIISSFRPLWGSFLFLSCPMETLPGIEKTCILRCKKFSPVKSGDSKLLKCSDPWFYALRCKTTILLALSSPFLDHKYDLTE